MPAFSFRLGKHCIHLISHINHLFQEPRLLPGDIPLLGGLHRPEPVFEKIVIRSADGMYIRICTMMVGDQKPLTGNHAAGAPEIKGNHSV